MQHDASRMVITIGRLAKDPVMDCDKVAKLELVDCNGEHLHFTHYWWERVLDVQTLWLCTRQRYKRSKEHPVQADVPCAERSLHTLFGVI